MHKKGGRKGEGEIEEERKAGGWGGQEERKTDLLKF